uniref:Uncharacterized protein n=1 Tax=Physcomitrium patens TaxID=3218 RepID=A0A2K1L768_PHYPA|nr:hypothetical protein PHYPA_000314 [Physcomitrium patens]
MHAWRDRGASSHSGGLDANGDCDDVAHMLTWARKSTWELLLVVDWSRTDARGMLERMGTGYVIFVVVFGL